MDEKRTLVVASNEPTMSQVAPAPPAVYHEPRCWAYMCGKLLAGHPEPPAESYHEAVLARARHEAARGKGLGGWTHLAKGSVREATRTERRGEER